MADTITFRWNRPSSLVLGSLIDTTSNYPIKDWKTFDAYQWPDPDSIDYTMFDQTAAALPDGMMMIAQPGGVFELAEGLMGYTGLCFAMADDPALVEAIFERIDIIYQAMYTQDGRYGQGRGGDDQR